MESFVENERESVSDLCKIGNTTRKQNMVIKRKRSGIIKSYGKSHKSGVKLIDRNTKKLMQMLVITE